MSCSKATCPSRFFITVQIDPSETPTTKSWRKVFKIRNASRFIINHQLVILLFSRKKTSGQIGCLLLSFFVHSIRLSIYSEIYLYFSFRVVAYWISSFLIASDEIRFEFYDYPYLNYLLYFYFLQKFLMNHSIYGTEEDPHMWPKRLPFVFCVFSYIALIVLIDENKKKLTICQRNKKLTKLLWILGQYDNGHVIKHVTVKSENIVLRKTKKSITWDLCDKILWNSTALF